MRRLWFRREYASTSQPQWAREVPEFSENGGGYLRVTALNTPTCADQIERLNKRELPPDWEKALPTFLPSPVGMATRDASGKVLNGVVGYAHFWHVGANEGRGRTFWLYS
jgi:transketolase